MFGKIKKMCEICRVINKILNKYSKNQTFPVKAYDVKIQDLSSFSFDRRGLHKICQLWKKY